MKRILIWLLLAGMAISLCTIPVAAAEPDAELKTVLKNQLSVSDREALQNCNQSADSLSFFQWKDQAVLVIYPNPIEIIHSHDLSEAVCSMEEILSIASESISKEYVVLESDGYFGISSLNGEMRILPSWYSELSYVDEVLSLGGTPEILGKTCKVQEIFCFEGSSYYRHGCFLYYRTDQGNYICYFKDQYSRGVWVTEAEFESELLKYNEYLGTFYRQYAECMEDFNLPEYAEIAVARQPFYRLFQADEEERNAIQREDGKSLRKTALHSKVHGFLQELFCRTHSPWYGITFLMLSFSGGLLLVVLRKKKSKKHKKEKSSEDLGKEGVE